MGSKKQKTETRPIYDPRVSQAANTVSSVYNKNAAGIQKYADALGKTGLALLPGAQGAVDASNQYITDMLGSDPAETPALASIIEARNNDLRNQMQAAMGTRGQTGGSSYADVISSNIARQSDELRYNDWYNQMQLRAQAAGMGQSALNPAAGAVTTGAGMPLNAATQYGATIGGLLPSGSTSTTKQSGGLLGGLLGTALSGWASGGFALPSDERLKTDIRRVGTTDGGLPIYTYRYKGEATTHMGVMAQEVKAIQPEALGPAIGDFMTVDYRKVA